MDVLQQLNAVIDKQNAWFELANMKQKIQFEAYRPLELNTICSRLEVHIHKFSS